MDRVLSKNRTPTGGATPIATADGHRHIGRTPRQSIMESIPDNRPSTYAKKQQQHHPAPSSTGPVTVTLPQTLYTVTHQVVVTLPGSAEPRLYIDILGHADKHHGTSRENYLDRRLQITESSVHLVELDLIDTGEHPPAYNFDKPVPDGPYRVLISNTMLRPQAQLVCFPSWDDAPTIQLPPLGDRHNVTLNLAQALTSRTA